LRWELMRKDSECSVGKGARAVPKERNGKSCFKDVGSASALARTHFGGESPPILVV
jgi:hypothetical protein